MGWCFVKDLLAHWIVPELGLLGYFGMLLVSLNSRSKHGGAPCVEPLEERRKHVQGVHGSVSGDQASWHQLLCGCVGPKVGQLHDAFSIHLEGCGQMEPE